jgi:hypothetical protein
VEMDNIKKSVKSVYNHITMRGNGKAYKDIESQNPRESENFYVVGNAKVNSHKREYNQKKLGW